MGGLTARFFPKPSRGDQAWLGYDSSKELAKLQRFTVKVLRIPASHFEAKSFGEQPKIVR